MTSHVGHRFGRFVCAGGPPSPSAVQGLADYGRAFAWYSDGSYLASGVRLFGLSVSVFIGQLLNITTPNFFGLYSLSRLISFDPTRFVFPSPNSLLPYRFFRANERMGRMFNSTPRLQHEVAQVTKKIFITSSQGKT